MIYHQQYGKITYNLDFSLSFYQQQIFSIWTCLTTRTFSLLTGSRLVLGAAAYVYSDCVHCTVQYSTVQNLTCQPGVMPSNAGTHTDISHTWTLRDTHTWAGFSIAIVSGLLWAIDWGIIILYCVLSYSTFTQYYLISVCLERWVGWWM